jgi:hypothetical protein
MSDIHYSDAKLTNTTIIIENSAPRVYFLELYITLPQGKRILEYQLK